MKVRLAVLGIWIVLISILSSCKDPEPVELRNIRFRDINSLGDNIEINTVIGVFNPNSFGATVDDANLVIYINEMEVGAINDIKEFSLPRKKETDIDITLKLKSSVVKSAVKKEWMKLLTGKDLNLIIKGDIHAKMGILSRKIPVSHTQDIKGMIKDLL